MRIYYWENQYILLLLLLRRTNRPINGEGRSTREGALSLVTDIYATANALHPCISSTSNDSKSNNWWALHCGLTVGMPMVTVTMCGWLLDSAHWWEYLDQASPSNKELQMTHLVSEDICGQARPQEGGRVQARPLAPPNPSVLKRPHSRGELVSHVWNSFNH